MLKKTLFIQSGCHLKTRYKQLVIANKKTENVATRPAEDIGFLVLDHPQITFTQSVIQLLTANNAGVVFCDERHHPASMLLNLDGNNTQSEHFRIQIETSIPLKKKLWQQTVKAKIRNQASVLEVCGYNADALLQVSQKVKSGDSTNEEARAARYYWSQLFGMDFIRSRHGIPPNNFLNFGYTVLRAAVARALTGSGLLPTLGIHHRNKYNAFCLADDIMEPYRPFVDLAVCEMCDSGLLTDDMGTEHKTVLLDLLASDVMIEKKLRPMMIALSETTSSLVRCFKREVKQIKFPTL